MHATLRAVFLAMGGFCAVGGRCAQGDALPSIFAPKAAVDPAATAPTSPASERKSPVSERLAGIIKDRLLEKARAFDVSALPIARPADTAAAVVMEKFVVNSEKVRKIELPPPVSPALRFLTTGRWFESLDGKTTGDFKLGTVSPAGALPQEDEIRFEISITRKF